MRSDPDEYSQTVQAHQGNHALHAVRGDLHYHAVQQYRRVQEYQQHPAQSDTAASKKPAFWAVKMLTLLF